jgi:hypothetical protein
MPAEFKNCYAMLSIHHDADDDASRKAFGKPVAMHYLDVAECKKADEEKRASHCGFAGDIRDHTRVTVHFKDNELAFEAAPIKQTKGKEAA